MSRVIPAEPRLRQRRDAERHARRSAALRRVGWVLAAVAPFALAAFFDEFVAVLRRPRAVVVVETFRSAREHADPHGRARALAEEVGGRYAPDGESAAHMAAELARPGEAVLVMGAGDVRPVGERVLELLRTPV